MAGLQGALESDAPVSRLHEHASYDPADFPVPTGREEEWRFTPLRRLRGLHGAEPLPEGRWSVQVTPSPEVKLDQAENNTRRRSGGSPRCAACAACTARTRCPRAVERGGHAVARGQAGQAERGDPRLGSVYVPTDRVSARAFASFARPP